MLTREQKEAVDYAEDLMLTACPGSGKTRVIVSKLSRVIEDVRETPRAIACITYTNTAVYEIEARLREHSQPGDEHYYDICTIHSFCLNHIFRPFCFLVDGYQDGFKVLTPECAEFQEYITAIWARHERYDLNFRDFEEFMQLRLSLEGEPIGVAIEQGAVTQEIAKEYWNRIRSDGFIDFANIIYQSLCLLRNHPEILIYLSSKFAWILVDEFQDTTDLQVELLSLIADEGKTKFLLVGDPYQSVFAFAGARPDLADEFAQRIGARTDLVLSGNFRSSPTIVDHANRLYSRSPPMQSIGPASDFTDQPVWEQGRSTFQIITESFLPELEERAIPIGDSAILVPSWYSLFPLGRRLREFGISIVGPGARPYRRSRLFAPLAEQVCGFLMEPDPNSIAAIERTLFNTLLDCTGRTYFEIFSYRGRTIVYRLLGKAHELHDDHLGAKAWLEAAASAFTRILSEEEFLRRDEHDLLILSVEDMKADIRNNRVDLENLTIEDLGIYSSPDSALKLSSLHNSKGREYSAVAMIDLQEGKIPFYRLTTADEFEEAKRLFYVGVTRAERFLFYVTDNSDRRNGPSRFLRGETGVGVC